MKMLQLSGVIVALVLISVTPASAQWLFDYVGFDYVWPNPADGLWGPVNYYEALGFVPAVNPVYLTADYANNEYTYYLLAGPGAVQIDTIAGIFVKFTYNSGFLDVYEDAIATGTAADYGINPRNATAPSTFTDGTLFLGGTFNSFVITLNLTTGDGSFSGDLDWDSGSQIGQIPPGEQHGWTFAGLGAGTPGTPEGYFWQVDGAAYKDTTTSTEGASWGEVKSLFR
jgi:hypothetical protein